LVGFKKSKRKWDGDALTSPNHSTVGGTAGVDRVHLRESQYIRHARVVADEPFFEKVKILGFHYLGRH
jgi:hypothetical protein